MMKIIKAISLVFCVSLITYVNSAPIEELKEIPKRWIEYKELFDVIDANDINNFKDLDWVNKDENDSVLLNLQNDEPFAINDHVGLHLYVKKNPDTAYLLNLENSKEAPIDINYPTKILVHGWKSEGNNTYSTAAKDAFFNIGDYNVIIVDYKKYARLDYPTACVKARKVGAYVGQVIVSLYEHNKIRLEDVHLFGVSLGGHVCGFIGKTVKEQSNGKVGRITGLDPAGPIFEVPVLLKPEKRLHKDDALFTDIIHTGGGSLGFRKALGHADFFPNSGLPVQPGCGKEIFPFGCSHIMACELFNESIHSDKFLATPCSSWKDFKVGKCDGEERVSMGHHLDVSKAKGNYYLYTNEISPRALG